MRQPALRALAARERVETRISRNPIEPGAKRATLEAVEAAPGAQVGFLHEVLGFMQGAQHAITVHLDFPPQRLSQPFKRLGFECSEADFRRERFGAAMGQVPVRAPLQGPSQRPRTLYPSIDQGA